MDLDLIGRGLVDLDLVGRALMVLGAALVCIGSFFMLRYRATRIPVGKGKEGINNEPRTPSERSNSDAAH
jgi:hypothetical protein